MYFTVEYILYKYMKYRTNKKKCVRGLSASGCPPKHKSETPPMIDSRVQSWSNPYGIIRRALI